MILIYNGTDYKDIIFYMYDTGYAINTYGEIGSATSIAIHFTLPWFSPL